MDATSALNNLLATLDTSKKELDSYRPFPPELIKHLTDWYRVELTYTSNALEGNSLSSSETAIVLEKGIAIGGKTVREHLEAINHAHAFDYILELARSNKNDSSLQEMYRLHWLILRGIDDENAGRPRRILVRITGSKVPLPDPIKLIELMDDFLAWLHSRTDHPVIIAALAHLKLVTIHPFVDGNGRTARLLMNLLLIQAGFPPAIVNPEQRSAYINALKQAQQNNNNEPFVLLIAQCVQTSLQLYLEHAKSILR